ncbi:transposase [Cucumis melo var. makuwa]|uniref:Transposase n=1 Tax=Cucumis melo var. makuwa TaxID=1194695 RepID=A0A5D3C365_CUCMM|nr:transposase [Cucumis melo var. makuwa]
MSFYGVIQDIWELNYNMFNVAMFRCNWVENNSGMKIDDLGFILSVLKRIGHKSDSFIMATQARQVFDVEDPSDARWSIVLTLPQRDCEDQSNDDELGDIMLHCQGVPNDMPNTNGVRDDQDREAGGAEIQGLVIGGVDEHAAFIINRRSRKSSFKTSGTTFCQINHWLMKRHILPFKNEPELFRRSPDMYSYINQKKLKNLLDLYYVHILRTKENFNKRNEKYNHRLLRKGYDNLQEDSVSLTEVACVDKKGQYNNEDVQAVMNCIDEISKTCADKEPSLDDVLTQALGTQESSGHIHGVGGFVTPAAYFHTAKCSKKQSEEIKKFSEDNENLCLRVQELETIHISTQFTPTSAHRSCSRQRLEYDIQCKKI